MPQSAIDRLKEGFRTFRETYYVENRALFDKLARGGQAPRVMLIGCADSRVDPLLITKAEPGDLFIVRNVANLVPPYAPDGKHHATSAAIEFAVRGLQVEHIIVMGHAQCGGVRALLEGVPLNGATDDFIAAWISIAERARTQALQGKLPAEGRLRRAEHETVQVSLDNLMTFPWIRERVDAGRLALHGWYFDLTEGKLEIFDRATRRFREVEAADEAKAP
jgi:carbonic anhydrase